MLMQLERREIICLPGGGGLCVVCLAGTLWVTREGDRRDHVLTDGQSLRCDRPGTAVVQALARSQLRVAAQSPAGAAAGRPLAPACAAVSQAAIHPAAAG